MFTAIGASGSGKSYTLTGNTNDFGSDIGLIGKSLLKCLSKINGPAYQLKVNSWELAVDGIRDLSRKISHTINTEDFSTNLLKFKCIRTAADVYAFITNLRLNRSTATTELNRYSSRSHMMTRIIIQQLIWQDLSHLMLLTRR